MKKIIFTALFIIGNCAVNSQAGTIYNYTVINKSGIDLRIQIKVNITAPPYNGLLYANNGLWNGVDMNIPWTPSGHYVSANAYTYCITNITVTDRTGNVTNWPIANPTGATSIFNWAWPTIDSSCIPYATFVITGCPGGEGSVCAHPDEPNTPGSLALQAWVGSNATSMAGTIQNS